jgi:hypothetical protein
VLTCHAAVTAAKADKLCVTPVYGPWTESRTVAREKAFRELDRIAVRQAAPPPE